jgi:hypothetical protein
MLNMNGSISPGIVTFPRLIRRIQSDITQELHPGPLELAGGT